MPKMKALNLKPGVSPAKLRLIADAIERDAMRQVAELRRAADMADGVRAVTVKAAPKKRAKKAAKRKAAKVARTKARKPARTKKLANGAKIKGPAPKGKLGKLKGGEPYMNGHAKTPARAAGSYARGAH